MLHKWHVAADEKEATRLAILAGNDMNMVCHSAEKNTGKLAGKETVILYLRDEVASMTPSAKRVKRFAKIFLEPGQGKTLTFTLSRDDLTFINTDNKPIAEPGEFTVMVGSLTGKFTLK